MVFYAHRLQDTLDSPTIVVITDRNDLDGQLYGQFAKCSSFYGKSRFMRISENFQMKIKNVTDICEKARNQLLVLETG